MTKNKFVENKNLEYSSVQKAITILLSFIPDNMPAGTIQLSESLGINKSTVSRLIQVLMHFGMVQQDERTRKYLLGRTATLLGMAVQSTQSFRLTELSQVHIEHLRDSVGESVCLEVLLSSSTKVISQAIGPPPLSVSFEDFLPKHVAAGAKAILAFTKPEIVDSIINGKLEKLTENTIADVETFKSQLQEINLQGIAYDHGEANKEVHAVSAPVFDHRGRPIAAVSICVPSSRVRKIFDKKFIMELKETARRISEQLFPPVTD